MTRQPSKNNEFWTTPVNAPKKCHLRHRHLSVSSRQSGSCSKTTTTVVILQNNKGEQLYFFYVKLNFSFSLLSGENLLMFWVIFFHKCRKFNRLHKLSSSTVHIYMALWSSSFWLFNCIILWSPITSWQTVSICVVCIIIDRMSILNWSHRFLKFGKKQANI